MIEKQNMMLEKFEGTRARYALPPTLSFSHSFALILLFALALGIALAALATLSLMWVAVVCVGLCCGLCLALCLSANWPLAPILQVVLLASLLFKLEVNIFPDFRYNESLPGLNISLMLIVSLMLLGAHIFNRWRGKPRDSVFPLGYSLASMTLLLWCILSILDSSEPLLGFYSVWGLVTVLLMCFVVANEFGNRAALRTAVIVLAVGFAVNGLVALLQSTTGMFADWTFLGAAREELRQTISEGEVLRASGFSRHLQWFGLVPGDFFARADLDACSKGGRFSRLETLAARSLLSPGGDSVDPHLHARKLGCIRCGAAGAHSAVVSHVDDRRAQALHPADCGGFSVDCVDLPPIRRNNLHPPY